ncbi:MAG TPA: HipA family kinase [Bryobacteraceae bacterium]|nr:HipA family kinase [Bryobacteraceae bacterium]
MPTAARRLIRKMRGGAQAHLLEAADGHCYVVKFVNNPQHRRILVNEWIAAVFLNYLGIASPAAEIVEISGDFLASNPDVHLQLGSRRLAPEPGWHFGSRFPGDPARIVVYDFLPDTILEKIENLGDFAGVLAFDKWMGNADARQSIFFRARLKDWIPGSEAHSLKMGFVAQMIDNGFVFDGPNWSFGDSASQGLYFRPMVYRNIRGFADFEPWLSRIVHFPEEVVDRAVKAIPPAWLAGEEEALDVLLARLWKRRTRVPDLIEASRRGRSDPFPDWK